MSRESDRAAGLKPGIRRSTDETLPFSSISARRFFAWGSRGFYGCGVKKDATIACWGEDWGQAMPPTGAFSSISVGNKYACGVKTDGSVVCW